jgi:branched-chain amino acid transport system permease protein
MRLNPKLLLLIAIGACFGFSFLAGSRLVNAYYLDIVLGIGINIILAVSLNLINGYTGQFSLGHAGFMSVGAYTAASVTTFAGPGFLGAFGGARDLVGVPILFLVALVAGGLVAALAGFAVGVPSLRLKGDYLAIVTLGFGEIIRVIFQNIKAVGGPSGLKGIWPYTNFFWTYGWVAVTIFTVLALVHSTYGRGFLAVHDDEIAASAMGVNTTRYKVTAFIVGSFFAGIAGGLYAHLKTFIAPAGFDFMMSIEIVTIVILGGMGNTPGVIAAAVLLTLLPQGLRLVAGLEIGGFSLHWVAELRMIIYASLIILIMLTRPQGLFSIRGLKPRKASS